MRGRNITLARTYKTIDERKQEAIAVAQTKQDEGLNEGSSGREGDESRFFLPPAAPTDKGRNGARAPEGWLLYTVDLEPRSYF